MTDTAVDPHLPSMTQTDGGLAPELPANIKATGLDRATLLDLALKTAHAVPQFTTEAGGALYALAADNHRRFVGTNAY